jgi:hypothetical protein
MGKPQGQVRVRGTCDAGHVTEAVSDPGRVRWEGPCAHDGCELTVKAKRIPGSTAKPEDVRTAGATDPADPLAVHEVEAWDDSAGLEFDDAPAGATGDAEPARPAKPARKPAAPRKTTRVRRPAGAGAGDGDGTGDGGANAAEPRAGRVARLRRGRRADGEGDRDWLVPGIFR